MCVAVVIVVVRRLLRVAGVVCGLLVCVWCVSVVYYVLLLAFVVGALDA